MSQDR